MQVCRRVLRQCAMHVARRALRPLPARHRRRRHVPTKLPARLPAGGPRSFLFVEDAAAVHLRAKALAARRASPVPAAAAPPPAAVPDAAPPPAAPPAVEQPAAAQRLPSPAPATDWSSDAEEDGRSNEEAEEGQWLDEQEEAEARAAAAWRPDPGSVWAATDPTVRLALALKMDPRRLPALGGPAARGSTPAAGKPARWGGCAGGPPGVLPNRLTMVCASAPPTPLSVQPSRRCALRCSTRPPRPARWRARPAPPGTTCSSPPAAWPSSGARRARRRQAAAAARRGCRRSMRCWGLCGAACRRCRRPWLLTWRLPRLRRRASDRSRRRRPRLRPRQARVLAAAAQLRPVRRQLMRPATRRTNARTQQQQRRAGTPAPGPALPSARRSTF